MKNIKAVVSDLDGTLLLSKSYIGAFTELVIKKLTKEKKKFIIATGRSKNEIIQITKKIDQLQASFFITLNGAKVYNQEWKLIKSRNLSPEVVKKILNLRDKKFSHIPHFLHKADQYDDQLNIDIKTKIAMDKCQKLKKESNILRHEIVSPISKIQEIKDFSELENFENVAKIVLAGKEESLIEYEVMILEKYRGEINAYLSTPNSLEIVDHKVSKGNALKEVLKTINIDLSETIAFGDGFNDTDMLKNVKKGLIMGNANYRLKEMLSYLEVIGTNDEEAVANYINENVLEEPIQEE
ncbi:HAD family hydrolase [Borreliella tanukii]|uniref:HAD family hydrolase n=1 Tax=Borreliella tanukii TaxID=56146 RepID=UPI002647B7B6|nr:HAD family hydrolase [Borreliella tanukii]WKC79492.1 HAD family hydrolase [Borreliella tanukii]WKC80412.1 HAD family hydrolase [Borreliella tanukii]WKC81325.1 HAD family hydrolase [Borreliella tanukii]WKC82241.1 HAD family hydrolase [Borreliella tanukii]